MSIKVPKIEMKDENKIPRIGLGTYNLKGEKCSQVIENALSLGYRHIDTAEMYSNEAEIGEAIRDEERSKLFLTSKVWPTNLQHETLIKACKNSLSKLQTSHLNLYLIHWPNPSVPLKEAMKAMNQLYEDDRAESIGVSNFTIPQVKEAIKLSKAPVCVNQVEFHPWLYQKDMLDFCWDNDIVLIAYAPLAKGQVLEEKVIKKIASEYGRTPAQIVLRWELQKGVIPIPKSSSKKHLQENLDIFDWELDSEDEQRIDNIDKEKRLINMHYSEF